MKAKIWLVTALMLVCGLAVVFAGCAGEADAIQAADIYTKSMAAMEQANSYAFEMEINQVIKFPEPIPLEAGVVSETMETQISSTGKAMQNPLAMEMIMQVHIPALTNIPEASGLATTEMKMYIVGDRLYMFNAILGGWIEQDLAEYGVDMAELSELSKGMNDPLYLFNLLGDTGAAKASITTEDQKFVISLTDDDGTLMNKLMGEVVGGLAEQLTGSAAPQEVEEMLNNMSYSNLEYKIRIDRDTYLADDIYLAFDLTMTIEGETLSFNQVSNGRYKDYGSFDVITVPDEIKSEAISMEDLLQNMLEDLDLEQP